jgi:hypothetical protein
MASLRERGRALGTESFLYFTQNTAYKGQELKEARYWRVEKGVDVKETNLSRHKNSKNVLSTQDFPQVENVVKALRVYPRLYPPPLATSTLCQHLNQLPRTND